MFPSVINILFFPSVTLKFFKNVYSFDAVHVVVGLYLIHFDDLYSQVSYVT